MKEDAQLICPISYDDPSGLWSTFGDLLSRHLPLHDVILKSPVTGSKVSIPSLPLRFMPSSANLFKDTNHPFRWFLAPYVYVYVLSVSDMAAYKAAKPALKAWVEVRQRAPWVILYALPISATVEQNSKSAAVLAAHTKIYDKLSSDFHAEKVGDRCVLMHTRVAAAASEGVGTGAGAVEVAETAIESAEITALVAQLRDGVLTSFAARATLYSTEIKSIDAANAPSSAGTGAGAAAATISQTTSSANNPPVDFRQLFLVKESLALMYQMVRLPYEALLLYDELQALLPQAQALEGQGSVSGWPLAPAPISSKASASTAAIVSEIEEGETGTGTGAEEAHASTAKDAKDQLGDGSTSVSASNDPGTYRGAILQGDDILSYSINSARKRILKSRLNSLELHRYIFARQAYFQGMLGQWGLCADRGLQYVKSTTRAISRRLDKEEAMLNARIAEAGASMNSPPLLSSALAPPRAPDESHPSMQQQLQHLQMLTAALDAVLVKRHAVDAWAIATAARIFLHCRQGFQTTHDGASALSANKLNSITSSDNPAASPTVQRVGRSGPRRVVDHLIALLQYCLGRIAAHENLLRNARRDSMLLAGEFLILTPPGPSTARTNDTPVLDAGLGHISVGVETDLLSLHAVAIVAGDESKDVDLLPFTSKLEGFFRCKYPAVAVKKAEDAATSTAEKVRNKVNVRDTVHMLSITLLMHLRQLQIFVERSSTAQNTTLQMADIFACSNSIGTSDGWRKALPLYESALGRAGGPSMGGRGPARWGWAALQYWLARKLMRAALEVGRADVYVRCAVQLQDPGMRTHWTLAEQRTKLFQSALNIAKNVPNVSFAAFPLAPFFAVHMRIPNAHTPTVRITRRKETVQAPVVSISTDLLCDGSDDSVNPLRSFSATVHSHMPSLVSAELVIIFSPLDVHRSFISAGDRVANLEARCGPRLLEPGDNNVDFSFECPMEQRSYAPSSVSILIRAPVAGDTSADLGESASISVKFVHQVAAEGAENGLVAMAHNYCVLSVQPPKVPVSLRLLTVSEGIGEDDVEIAPEAVTVIAKLSSATPETEGISDAGTCIQIPAGTQGTLRVCVDLPNIRGEVRHALHGVQLTARADDQSVGDDGGNGDSDNEKGENVDADSSELVSSSANEDKTEDKDVKVAFSMQASSAELQASSALQPVPRNEPVSDAQGVQTVAPALVFRNLQPASTKQTDEKISGSPLDLSYACSIPDRLTSSSVLYVPFASADTSPNGHFETRSIVLRVHVTGFFVPLAALPSSNGAPFAIDLLLNVTIVQALQVESISRMELGNGHSKHLLRGVLHNQSSSALEVWVPPLSLQDAAVGGETYDQGEKGRLLLEKTLLQPEQRLHVVLCLPAVAPASVILHCRAPGLGKFQRLLRVAKEVPRAEHTPSKRFVLRAKILHEKHPGADETEKEKRPSAPLGLGLGQVVQIQYKLMAHASMLPTDGVYCISLSPVKCVEWACIGCGEITLSGNRPCANSTEDHTEMMVALPAFTFTFVSLSAGHTVLPAVFVSPQHPPEQEASVTVPVPVPVPVSVPVQQEEKSLEVFVRPIASFRTVSVSYE